MDLPGIHGASAGLIHEYLHRVRVDRGNDSLGVYGDQAAGNVRNQALAESLGSLGTPSREIVKLCELSFVCLKVFDESLKGLSHELALANRG